jgi:hypothetical protein
MKHIFFLLAVLFFITPVVSAQKYFTKNGHISFFSKAPLENIKADNNQVVNVLSIQNGAMQFSMLIKNFHFAKSLMEVHFNENYMESAKFPTAGFKGAITNIKEIAFAKDGIYNATVTGDMTIHGVTKKLTATGAITVSGGKISLRSKFIIKLADYNISIPKMVIDKVAESVEITVNSEFSQKN